MLTAKKHSKKKPQRAECSMEEKYVLREMIGQGQFGKVYRGEAVGRGEDVAVKVISNTKLGLNEKLGSLIVN